MAVKNENGIDFEEALIATGNGRYNRTLVVTCALILLAIGADLFGFSLVVTSACDLELTVSQKGVLTSLPFIGIFLVSYLWGYISDTRGRRFTLLLSLPMGFLLSSLSSLSPNWIVLAVGKFLAVCFSCAPNSATYTLVGESCCQRVRSKYMLLMTSMMLFSPGGAALMTYPTLQMDFAIPIPWLGIHFTPWRLLCIILSLPLGCGGIAIYFFHESPKFLANCGRKEDALAILKNIYSINNSCPENEFKVNSIKLEDEKPKKEYGLVRMMWEQSAPLFRPPLLFRTLQLFYIVAVVYITNNSFLVWLPHIMGVLMKTLEKGGDVPGSLCELIAPQVQNDTWLLESNSTLPIPATPPCRSVEDNTIWTLSTCAAVFSFLNFIISHFPNRRKTVLMGTLTLSSISAILINLMPEPISSVFFFMMFTITCLGMGILASYFVDFYPTSHRGMAACLSIMVGRTSTFIGINVVGNLLFNHCNCVFYFWSLLLISSIVAAWFLPPDKPPAPQQSTKL